MQKIINPLIKENKDVNGAIKGTMLTIANSNPISLASSIIPNDALSRNEQREILGYEPEEAQEPQNIEE